MRLFNSRPFLAVVLTIGLLGVVCLLRITYGCFADHRSFPWVLWLGGIQWLWCTWLAGHRLLKRGAEVVVPRNNASGEIR
jgi:hypothetical protein